MRNNCCGLHLIASIHWKCQSQRNETNELQKKKKIMSRQTKDYIYKLRICIANVHYA